MIRGSSEARRGCSALASLVLGLAVLGACSSSGRPTPHPTSTTATPSPNGQELPTFEIDVTAGVRYRLPKVGPAGAVTIELINGDGGHAHGAALYLLHSGVTMSQFTARVQSSRGLAGGAALASPAGGPAGIGPRQHGSVVTVLRAASTYAVVSDVAGSDGNPDYRHGLIAGFTTGAGSGVDLPGVPGNQIVLRDGGTTVGPSVDWTRPIQVINDGKKAQGLQILAAAADRSLTQVRRYLTSPKGAMPYVAAGGVSSIAPGTIQLLNPATPAGDYLVAATSPDAPPHALSRITVT